MGRIVGTLYGIAAYFLFLFSVLYAIGFIGNIMVPKSIDSGATDPLRISLVIDIALLGLFAVQHSGMARQGFKRWLTRFVHPSVERSTYVALASLVLLLIFWQWRPLPEPVWTVQNPIGIAILRTVFWAGWGMLLVSTFMISHFELFGLRQVFARLRGKELPESRFRTPGLYRMVRHPIYLSFLLAFWATPSMSVGRLLFSAATTGYILIGIQLEERDLIALFGDRYRQYRSQVAMLLPLPQRRPVRQAEPLRRPSERSRY